MFPSDKVAGVNFRIDEYVNGMLPFLPVNSYTFRILKRGHARLCSLWSDTLDMNTLESGLEESLVTKLQDLKTSIVRTSGTAPR